jgi:hypothetical protein
MTLHVARNLDLPIDAVTQTFGMIGRRGCCLGSEQPSGLREASRGVFAC